jgi:hypothetical protein
MTLDFSKIKMSATEKKTLSKVSSNWNVFHEAHKRKPFSPEALLKVLKLEATLPGRQRPTFGYRVLGMYHRLVTQENYKNLSRSFAGKK